MQIIDNLIILALIVASFFVGKTISDRYNRDTIEYLMYALRLNSAERGVGYVAPPTRKSIIGQQFMDKLKENGRATQAIRTPRN